MGPQLKIGRFGGSKISYPPIRLISVVIPVKNNPEGLRVVLTSVREAEKRSPVPVELVVVNDGSTDGTEAVALEFGAKVVQQPGNGRYVGPGLLLGVGKTRNAGILASTGDVIASLDADCRVDPHYFQRIAKALANHDFVALNQLPIGPDPGKLTYKLFADIVFKLGAKGAAEPSVAFRRAICPDALACFTPEGYAEILGVSKRAQYGASDTGNTVYTDMSKWRQRAGWAILVALGLVVGNKS